MPKYLGEVELVNAVRKHGPITATKLAEVLNRDMIGLRRRLVKLQKSGLIKSQAGHGNSKLYFVSKYSQSQKLPNNETDVSAVAVKQITPEELWRAASKIQSKPDPWQLSINDIATVVPLAIAEIMLNGKLTTEKIRETLTQYIKLANEMAHQAERLLVTDIRPYPDKDYQDLAKSLVERFAE